MSAPTKADRRPTRVEIRAAQMVIERGVGPAPSDAIRQIAKATPRD